MVEEINHLSFRQSYHQNELPLENEFNTFRDTLNQLSIDQIIAITNKSRIP